MQVAIIIGFTYDKINPDTSRSYLPGIIIDLYQAYKYVQGLAANKIIVITDLYQDISVSEVKSAITESIVDMEICKFISQLIQCGNLVGYTHKQQIINIIIRETTQKNRIFLYYTGHCSRGNLLLPYSNGLICYRYDNHSDSFISFVQIRDLLAQNATRMAEIFIILDCCNSNGMELPYKLMNSVYRLTQPSNQNEKLESMNRIYFTQKFICLSASYLDESSIASKSGSLFSYSIFQYIKKYRNISKLLEAISIECSKKFDQTSNIYSSYPDVKCTFNWLISNFNFKLKFNPLGNYFVLDEI